MKLFEDYLRECFIQSPRNVPKLGSILVSAHINFSYDIGREPFIDGLYLIFDNGETTFLHSQPKKYGLKKLVDDYTEEMEQFRIETPHWENDDGTARKYSIPDHYIKEKYPEYYLEIWGSWEEKVNEAVVHSMNNVPMCGQKIEKSCLEFWTGASVKDCNFTIYFEGGKNVFLHGWVNRKIVDEMVQANIEELEQFAESDPINDGSAYKKRYKIPLSYIEENLPEYFIRLTK